MDKQSRDMYVEIELLKILDQFKGNPCREDALRDQYTISCPGVKLSPDEFAGYLEILRGKGFIVYRIPTLGPKTWIITPAGKAVVDDYRYQEDF